jgi:peptidoglycan/LPS O-acetylase OafA/YrhL
MTPKNSSMPATETKPLLHLWSILLMLAAISLIYSSIAVLHDPTAAFYSPLSRLWELGAGGVLSTRRVRMPYPGVASCLGLILIIGAALKFTSLSPFPGLLATIPVAGLLRSLHRARRSF